jgi:trans-aconitate methyltransferase
MDENHQLALYDRQAKAYDAFAGSSPTWEHVEAPAFYLNLKPLLGASVKLLELGCGAGRLAEYLAISGISRENITGVDISREMLAFARAKLPEATFVRQDIQALDLPYKSYDLATANMVFESLNNEQLFVTLRHVRQHLRSGATLMYVTTHPLRNFDAQCVYLERKWIEVTTPWGAQLTDYHRPVSDFVNITQDAGFRINTMQELGFPLGRVDDSVRVRYEKCPAVRLAIKAVVA